MSRETKERAERAVESRPERKRTDYEVWTTGQKANTTDGTTKEGLKE